MRNQTQRQKATAGTGYRIEPHESRFFALYDEDGELVGIFVYLKGAAYVARKMEELKTAVIAAAAAAKADLS